MAATSLTTHIAIDDRLGKLLAAHSARLRPVTMPSLADSAWNSMAIRLATQHHPEQRVAVFGAGLDVGGEIAGVHIGDRGNDRRAGEGEISPRPAALRR